MAARIESEIIGLYIIVHIHVKFGCRKDFNWIISKKQTLS